MNRKCRIVRMAGLVIIGLVLAEASAAAGGWITGDTGGNERDAAVFDRDGGMMWFAITGPDGRFTSPKLPAGEYMALSRGQVARVLVKDGRRTEIVWTAQPGYGADTETWSPLRAQFGQTFVAFSPWVKSVTLWLPGPALDLVFELREDGPHGRLVGRREMSCVWVSTLRLKPGEWPTKPRKTYYLSITGTEGQPFRIGMPALGEVYEPGTAFYDGEAVLDSDLGINVDGDNDGLITTLVHGAGLGFKSEGPASGSCRWAAQEFVAVTRNVVTAYANAGWPSAEGIKHEFVFSIHRGSPEGEQVGPSRTAWMIKDWGTTAVWFPDQVRVEPGETYVMKFARTDGQPFYAYLAEDTYPQGRALRAGLQTPPDLDLTCDIRGERNPGGLQFPYNISVIRLESQKATVAWETAIPTTGDLRYRRLDGEWRNMSEGDGFRREHAVTITGLTPGVEYEFAVQGWADLAGAANIRSKVRRFTTLTDPSYAEISGDAPPPAGARRIELTNQGFENGLDGWLLSPPPREGYPDELPGAVGAVKALPDLGRHRPFSGRSAIGWRHDITSRSGEVPRKLEPPLSQTVWQRVRVEKGGHYILSAWILTDEAEGGWNRNDRIRLCVDPTGQGHLGNTGKVDERHVTQWYTTRGRWVKRRLAFTAEADEVDVGLQFYQWWLLRENRLYADEVRLLKIEAPVERMVD